MAGMNPSTTGLARLAQQSTLKQWNKTIQSTKNHLARHQSDVCAERTAAQSILL